MGNRFSTEYSKRRNDELLLLASDRTSLTAEAAMALDAELQCRGLSHSDRVKHQKLVKRYEQRESRGRRRKLFGTRANRPGWIEFLMFWLAVGVISFIYVALPSRYQLKHDWQEAAINVMFATVAIIIVGKSWWRRIGFWVSLFISSSIHLFIVHSWMQQAGNLNRGQGKLAVLLGFVLFFALYGFVWLLRRNFYGTRRDL